MVCIRPNIAARNRLPDRRASVTFSFECNSIAYSATISRYPNGDLAEIFISNSKAGSHSDSAAKDLRSFAVSRCSTVFPSM